MSDQTVSRDLVSAAMSRGEDDFGRFAPTKVERTERHYSTLYPHPKNPRDPRVFQKSSAFYRALNTSFDAANGWIPGNDIIARPHPDLPAPALQVLKGHFRRIVAHDRGIDMMPTTILHGISDRDALAIVLDHNTVAGLDEVERLNSVRAMVSEGYGRKRMQATLNCDNNQIQKYLDYLLLPPSVIDAWATIEREGRGEKILAALPFNPTVRNLKALVTAVKADNDNAEFIGPVDEGPEFVTMMDSLVKDKTSPPAEKEKDVFSGQDLARIGATIHGAPVTRELLERVGGKRKGSVDKILGKLQFAERFVVAYVNGDALPTDETMLALFKRPSKIATTATDSTATDSTATDSTATASEVTASEATASEATASEATDSTATDSTATASEATASESVATNGKRKRHSAA